MSASTNDKVTDTRNAARPNPTTVSVGRSAAGTTLSCASLTGWPTASKVHFVTYRIDSAGDPVAGTQLDCSGIVSGNDIGSLVVIDGTDTGNAIGDVVEMLPTAAWGQDLADALTAQHSRVGAHVGITNTGGMTTDTLIVTSGTTLPAGDIVTADLANSAVTPAKLLVGTGASWTLASWTPTLSGLFTDADWTKTCTFIQVGKIVFFRLQLTSTDATPMAGAGEAIFTLPVTSVSYPGTAGTTQQIGRGNLLDAGTATYDAAAYWLSTTTAQVKAFGSGGSFVTPSTLSSTSPFTFTTTDEIYIQGWYEAA